MKLLLSIVTLLISISAHALPAWDATKLMAPDIGNNTTLNDLSYLATFDPASHSQDGTGAFRISCKASHMLPDDPLVFPNQQGAAHLHTFFGNTSVNAFTKLSNIANQGSSTCSVGTGNRSGYWVPTIIDLSDGSSIAPYEVFIYYKSGYNLKAGLLDTIQSFPPGLRMIVGDHASTAPIQRYDYSFSCNGASGALNIPACNQNGFIQSSLDFKQCWDGVNIDSANHKSHMANTVNVLQPGGGYKAQCPTSHPVLLPKITFIFKYRITKPEGTLNWALSSDSYPKINYNSGYSMHGDWINGWKPALMNSIVVNCLRKGIDCNGIYSIPVPAQ